MFLVWFVVCFTGAVGPVANIAHAVGLLVGTAVGFVPSLIRK
jgi:membrane associated rhomboid family serine protease